MEITCQVRPGVFTLNHPQPMCGAEAVYTVKDTCPDGWSTYACAEHLEQAKQAYPSVKVTLIGTFTEVKS
jgi:rRNA maturation protein Nop10